VDMMGEGSLSGSCILYKHFQCNDGVVPPCHTHFPALYDKAIVIVAELATHDQSGLKGLSPPPADR